MRHVLALPVGIVALGVATGGQSAPTASEARSCAQLSSSFNVQILGSRSWGFGLERVPGIPDKRTVVAVWSFGGPTSTSGIALYGWIMDGRSQLSTRCTSVRTPPRPPRLGDLRAPVRVKDGWAYGRKFACQRRGRFVVAVQELAGGRRLTVRMQKTGELIAVGEVRNGSGWLRATTRCQERER